MSDAEIREAAAALVRRSCEAQGVPVAVAEPSVLAKVASLLKGGRPPGS